MGTGQKPPDKNPVKLWNTSFTQPSSPILNITISSQTYNMDSEKKSSTEIQLILTVSCSRCDTRWHVVYVNEKKQGTKDSALGDARSHFTLCRVFTFEDYFLGATGKNLSWNNHVNNITKKANSTLAFLRRNIRNCPQRAKTQAYNTLFAVDIIICHDLITLVGDA
jgi:hypothetical protein